MAIPLLTPQINSLKADSKFNIANLELEKRIEEAILWNSAAIVHAAEFLQSKKYSLGGHTATPASASTLFLVGLLHHFRQKDHVYYQGHSSPWVYGLLYLLGKLQKEDLQSFRRLGGIPSYPHPFLLPDVWENATVSMGLAPLFGIYQAKFEKYLETALNYQNNDVRIWVTVGDGECEEPEALGCARVAERYDLDNLCFIVNINHQSLDGPVQGNGSVIRELESAFHGMGWKVIKVLWGEKWDEILSQDKDGSITEWLNQINDGTLLASIGLSAERSKEVLLETTSLPKRLAEMSAEELQGLMRDRGGHSIPKVHQAMCEIEKTKGQPSIILAQTIKGYKIPGGEARYPNHKLIPSKEQMVEMAKNFSLDIDFKELEPRDENEPPRNPFFRFPVGSPELNYLNECRDKLSDSLRIQNGQPMIPKVPDREYFRQAVRFGAKEYSTTQVFNSLTRAFLRRKELRELLVPIMVDEARTFGFDGFFPLGIWNPHGQNYFSAESEYNKVSYFRESPQGRIIQEGINEVGAMSTFISAGRAYRTHGIPLIPVLMFYSQFFGRMFDEIWAGGDMLARGLLLGCTAGTTTLNGEGLQHADRHTPHMAAKIPPIRVYEMAYADALAILAADGFKTMLEDVPNTIYYIRLFNEKWSHQSVPKGWEEGVIKGGYPLKHWRDLDPKRYMRHPKERKSTIWASGPTLPLALEAQEILAEKYDILSNVYDITSYHLLARGTSTYKRKIMLNPDVSESAHQKSFINELIFPGEELFPICATMDASGAIPAMVGGHVRAKFDILAPTGWGRSGTRDELRNFFEISPRFIVARVLSQLNLLNGNILKELDIDPKKPWPGRTWPPGLDQTNRSSEMKKR